MEPPRRIDQRSRRRRGQLTPDQQIAGAAPAALVFGENAERDKAGDVAQRRIGEVFSRPAYFDDISLPSKPSWRQKRWCGRPDLNRHGVSPNGFSYQLRLSPPPPPWRLWSGLSLHPSALRLRCCPSSLYTFTPALRPECLARDCHVTGFPDFEQFCIARFRASTQVLA